MVIVNFLLPCHREGLTVALVVTTNQHVPSNPDVELGHRLRLARRRTGLSQTDFALRLQIGRERLASYESGRVPLPWAIAHRACSIFEINPAWLVEGAEPQETYLRPAGIEEKQFASRATLREVYSSELKPFYAKLRGDELSIDEEAGFSAQIGPKRQMFVSIVEQLPVIFDALESKADKFKITQEVVAIIQRMGSKIMMGKSDSAKAKLRKGARNLHPLFVK